jgi:hypothetical protein
MHPIGEYIQATSAMFDGLRIVIIFAIIGFVVFMVGGVAGIVWLIHHVRFQ